MPDTSPLLRADPRHMPGHWIAAYARGELSPELLAHAEAHLGVCRACADAVDLAVRGGPHGPRLAALHDTLFERIGCAREEGPGMLGA
ncbi:zf-HC2 domain-containing protein [Streptomyces sp. HUAS MG47]|uniref:zf-HC2 domain-containing protein n=1 Tax=Streptomyces solicamelliae TaxID=3231716 RepID=UPI0038779268